MASELTQEEKKQLLAIARRTISRYVSGAEPPKVRITSPGLGLKRGAFVTLHKQGMLRGCIGNFRSDLPLAENVQNMAIAAATQDPRFPPVSPFELDDIDIEISVLSPLRPIKDINEIQVGTHGIYIVSPRGSGVLLPQVATEYGWDRLTFLDQTCLKAGLEPGCWQRPDVEVLVFSADVFGEKELGRADEDE